MAWVEESELDDADRLAAVDRAGMLRALATAGAQVRRAARESAESGIARLTSGERPRAVLVVALGSSELVADAAQVLVGARSPVPVLASRGEALPGWVGPLDLVVAVSQSGRAAGPVRMAAEAARRGAALLTVGEAGSPLDAACAQARGFHVPVGTDATAGSSRSSLWSLLVPVLLGLDAAGLVPVRSGLLARVADRLDAQAATFRPTSDAFVNPAKSLAIELADGVPVLLGRGPVCGLAARRAAAMLARTARVPSMVGQWPDSSDPVIACLGGLFGAGSAASAHAPGGRPGATPVDGPVGSRGRDIFADPYLDGPEHPRMRLVTIDGPDQDQPGSEAESGSASTFASVARLARETGVPTSELTTEAAEPLEALAELISLIDFAATYLAVGLGIDPSGPLLPR